MSKKSISLLCYTARLVEDLQRVGRERTAETYLLAARSFCGFMGNLDVSVQQVDFQAVMEYELHLRSRGLVSNTTSFYLRNLRAIYNRAADEGIVVQSNPFRRVYTGTSKTTKRAISADVVRRILMFKTENQSLRKAIDMFMFSFYTRGMAFVDMAYLTSKNLRNGNLVYRRRKTGEIITVQWEECMQKIVDRYSSESITYMLPIIKGNNPRREYLNAAHAVNRNLKRVGAELGIQTPLTLYVARHSWASIALLQQVSISTISRALGHNSESTTKIYLASLDNSAVDCANRLVLDAISF